VQQPIGEFFIGAISASELCEITWTDVRRIEGERGFETYLGIQRPLNPSRVRDIANYVKSPDACFPTAVILSIPGTCASYDPGKGMMTLSEYFDPDNSEENVEYSQIAKVIDGQHRIEGLRNFDGKRFEVNVSIFIDMDIADQAYLFSTVNLAQTKVNRSLVYDLYELAKTRSPQKTCHEMAVALDQHEKSPLHQRIKRLGVSTEGRFNETITQATFVKSVLTYISEYPLIDRNLLMQRKKPKPADEQTSKKLIFRNMFLEENDLAITDIVWNYFEAVRNRWPTAWTNFGRGSMLNKTNGFRALMRFLRPSYLHLCAPGNVPSENDFLNIFRKTELGDDYFTTDRFKPGTSGESLLFHELCASTGIVK
jgi:DGQHR domain-containing protein